MISVACAFWTLNGNIEKSEEEKRLLAQKMFSSSVRQDIIVGADAEVYKKCLTFSARPDVAGIEIRNLGKAFVCSLAPSNSKRVTEIQTAIYFDKSESDMASVIRIWYYLPLASEGLIKTGLILILSLLVLVPLQYFAIKYTTHLFLNPITFASKQLAEKGITWIQSKESMSLREKNLEVFTFLKTLEILLVNLQNQEVKLGELRTNQALGTLAVQVAHDIRSPLAALRVAVSQMNLTEDTHSGLIKSAIFRITEISETLTAQYRHSTENISNHYDPIILLREIVSEIVTEKRAQLNLAASDLKLIYDVTTPAVPFFVRNSRELKRILSNLISNSFEAIEKGGTVRITEAPDPASDSNAVLTILDNGFGMSPYVLSRSKEAGFTFGKVAGTGLGLSHADRSMQAMGGSLQINSEPGIGTEAILLVPLVFETGNFCLHLKIQKGSHLVIYDDDISIINAWKKLLEAYAGAIEIHYFQKLNQFEEYMAQSSTLAATFLIDFDLANDTKNGIELIEERKIAAQTYLVTSHSNNPTVVDAASKIGLKIIPKDLIESVTLEFSYPDH